MFRSLLLLILPLVLIGCTTSANDHSKSTQDVSPEAAAMQPSEAEASTAASYRDDASSIVPLINNAYAYLDRFGSAGAPVSEKLHREAEEVNDRRSLLRYAERVLLTLSDHHAITGSSLAESWAVVPSYADLWVVEDDGVYTVDAIRGGSPAQEAGIRRGDRIVSVEGVPIQDAVFAFWADLGLPVTSERAAFAARVLAAGRRDRPRRIQVQGEGAARFLELPSLYATPPEERSLVTVTEEQGRLTIRINDTLGDTATIAAFDAAMSEARNGQPVVIDLRETPSGGNTTVARAILGWFVDQPRTYQIHNLPTEERLEHSGLVIKLPTERLSHVDGTPREEFVPEAAGK